MKFFSDFYRGVSNCFKAFSLLFQKGVWHYLLYQFILWLLLLILSIYGIFTLSDYISNWLRPYLGIDAIPDSGHWLSAIKPYLAGVFAFLIGITLKVFSWFILGTLTKYLLLIVLSPILALLSERADEKLTGNTFPFSFSQLLKDIFRGIVISLRNMLFEYACILGCFIITLFIPPLGIITTPLILLIGWYFTGFTLLDYNCERYKLGIRGSINLVRQNKGYACGIGLVYSFFLALPFSIGTFIGLMFGPAVTVIGGTTSFLEITKKLEKV